MSEDKTTNGTKTLAEQEFERWRKLRDPQLKRESFVTAWAKVAWLAEGRMHAMGRDLAKLQYRIGRQRKANRELRNVLRLREEELEACRRVVSVAADIEACLRSDVEVPEFMKKTFTDRLDDLDLVRAKTTKHPIEAEEGCIGGTEAESDDKGGWAR